MADYAMMGACYGLLGAPHSVATEEMGLKLCRSCHMLPEFQRFRCLELETKEVAYAREKMELETKVASSPLKISSRKQLESWP